MQCMERKAAVAAGLPSLILGSLGTNTPFFLYVWGVHR